MATPTNLPASFSVGAVLTADQMNDMRGAFRVLQVVSAGTTLGQFTTSTTYADVSGLSATITPSSTSSKVLVIVSLCGGSKEAGGVNNGLATKVIRGASTLVGQVSTAAGANGVNQLQIVATLSGVYLDAPNTTSATTYKAQFATSSAGIACYLQRGGEGSTITLLEISA